MVFIKGEEGAICSCKTGTKVVSDKLKSTMDIEGAIFDRFSQQDALHWEAQESGSSQSQL